MPQQRLVIIGGVAAGMSAASRARKLDPQLEIVVLEKGRHVSYGTCGLPYYLSGQVADASELVVYTAEFFREMAGEEGIAKRIDVAAMALHARMRVPEMLHLDLSYAPPFAPAWDPLVIAANEAQQKISRS